jgi:acetylglutamate kinase
MTALPGTGPVVAKLGGAALDDAAVSEPLLSALADLHRALPRGLVLVHGGGSAVDRQLARLGLTSEKRHGIRITPPEHLEQVVAILAGLVNTTIVGGLALHGARAVGLSLGSGGLTRASKVKAAGFDPGRVGAITDGDPTLLLTLLRAGFLPVLSSIALDGEGVPLNINADDAAVAIATIAHASALLLLTDVAGVLDAQKTLIPQIDAAGIEALIEAGTVTGGMIPKIRAAAQAADTTGIPAVIASWNRPKDLGALARGGAVGTRIVPRRP